MTEKLKERTPEEVIADLEEELRGREEMIKALVAAREEPYVPQPKGPRVVVDNVVPFPADSDVDDVDDFWETARSRCRGHVVIVGVNSDNLYIGSSLGMPAVTHFILSHAAHMILRQSHEDVG